MEIEREEREATWESKRSLVNWNSFGGILYYSYNRSPQNSIGKKPE